MKSLNGFYLMNLRKRMQDPEMRRRMSEVGKKRAAHKRASAAGDGGCDV